MGLLSKVFGWAARGRMFLSAISAQRPGSGAGLLSLVPPGHRLAQPARNLLLEFQECRLFLRASLADRQVEGFERCGVIAGSEISAREHLLGLADLAFAGELTGCFELVN